MTDVRITKNKHLDLETRNRREFDTSKAEKVV